MPRLAFALIAVLVVPFAAADDSKPVVPPEPEYECRFDDGSVVRLTVGTAAVKVKTKFGLMTVPLAEAKKVEMGFRYPAGVEAKVKAAVDDLASPDFRTREAAQKVLIEVGEYAVPLVKAGTQNGTPEVAERCAAILKKITATLPADKSDPVMEDVITTDEMVLRGTITSDSFKATSKYFAETTVKLVDVRELRPVGGRFVGTFPLDSVKYAAAGWKTFFDTGLEVEKGQPLEVTATGKIDLAPQTPGKFTSGPNGGGTQVPGPGAHMEEKMLGGGRGIPPGEFGGYGTLYTSGAVYGRIGATGKLFKIGEKLTLPKAEEAGRLYLVIAPSSYGGSKGEYEVKVRLGK
jgi:hypothetical protein